MNIYLTKEQTKVLKEILKQELFVNKQSTWEVNGERNFIYVDILLMKITKNWFETSIANRKEINNEKNN